MKQYMADINLPKPLPSEFISLIPEQRKAINELMAEGVISTYSLTLDRSKLWVIFFAESETDAMKHISSFPLFKFMNIKIHELAFHENASIRTPHFSLN
jgi:muconolactone delta-isomerase